jgi:hypothetical protein
MRKKFLAAIITAIFCLTVTLFMVFPTRSTSDPNWNPEADINHDGKVDMTDAILFSNAYGSSGEPISRLDEASYIIYTVGSKYYCKNGTSGVVTAGDTDASSVINNAIQALTSTGGEVLLRSGKYTLTKPINVNVTGLTLKGESEQSVWIYPDSTSRPDRLITVKPATTPPGEGGLGADTGNMIISDLSFNNTVFKTYNLTSAIYIDTSTQIVWLVTVESCYFMNLDAIHTSFAGNYHWCLQHSTFRDLEVVHPHWHAFQMLDAIGLTFDNIWIYFPYRVWTPGTMGLYLNNANCSEVSTGDTIHNFECFYADYGINMNSTDDNRLTDCICDLAGIAYEIYNSSRSAFTNCYASAPNNLGLGFHLKHLSSDTVFTNCQARCCKYGFFADTGSEAPGISAFIGCSSTLSTVSNWGYIGPNDMRRGCFDNNSPIGDR